MIAELEFANLYIVSGLTPTDYAQIISAIGTMVATIVAVIAAIQSYRSAKQNNETNEQMIRPRVVVYVDNSRDDISLIDLIVHNEGGGFAKNIKFKIKGDDLPMSFSDAKDRNLSDFDIIREGIKFMPSKSVRRYFLLSTIGQVDKILKKRCRVSVSYENSTANKKYQDEFLLDFMSLPRMRFTNRNETYRKKLANETEKIRKIMESNT